MPIVPFKLNQDRRHHIPRQRRKVTNWPAYDASLRQRGGLTIWPCRNLRAKGADLKSVVFQCTAIHAAGLSQLWGS